jgi:hypothetical protein
MGTKRFATVVGASAAALLVPLLSVSDTRGQEKADPPRQEFKAVSFGDNDGAATEKLNDLAAEGWEYVGPLGNGLVAFRRPVPRSHIVLGVVGTPEEVAPGEKTTITVTVRAGDGSPLANARVAVSSGGGRFLPKADEPFDPKDRLHGPYKATGTTDEKGRFTTWWVCNPAAPGYVLGIEATKEGYTSGKAHWTIRIKP